MCVPERYVSTSRTGAIQRSSAEHLAVLVGRVRPVGPGVDEQAAQIVDRKRQPAAAVLRAAVAEAAAPAGSAREILEGVLVVDPPLHGASMSSGGPGGRPKRACERPRLRRECSGDGGDQGRAAPGRRRPRAAPMAGCAPGGARDPARRPGRARQPLGDVGRRRPAADRRSVLVLGRPARRRLRAARGAALGDPRAAPAQAAVPQRPTPTRRRSRRSGGCASLAFLAIPVAIGVALIVISQLPGADPKSVNKPALRRWERRPPATRRPAGCRRSTGGATRCSGSSCSAGSRPVWYLSEPRPEPVPEEPDELLAAVDLSLEDLENDPDARRAVIRAYARMERALGSYGLARRPSETPLEYLARALTSLRVGRRVGRAPVGAVRAREVQPARDRPLDEGRCDRRARSAARRAGRGRDVTRWGRRRVALTILLAIVAIALGVALSGAARGDRAVRVPAAPGADRGVRHRRAHPHAPGRRRRASTG